MKKEIRRSVWPVYIPAAVWILWCLLLPMHRVWHFIIALAVTAIVYLLMKKIFPNDVKVIEEPVTTGDTELDELFAEGEKAIGEMTRLSQSARSEEVKQKIDKLIVLARKIIQDAKDDPKDRPRIKRFLRYYLPTTLKLLNAYDRMDEQGIEGENIDTTKENISGILDRLIESWQKQLDALFSDEALDIETDIKVLDALMAGEGLAGRDFKQTEGGAHNG